MPQPTEVPTEVHIYYEPGTEQATLVAVYALGSGVHPTRLTGTARLDFDHDHRPGGIAPAVDTVHIGLTFRDAADEGHGRHRQQLPDQVAA